MHDNPDISCQPSAARVVNFSSYAAQPVINNASKGYSVVFCGGTDANLHNASIDYTLP